jgi:hypothetical protein
LSGEVIQQVVSVIHDILELLKPIVDRKVLGLLLRRIQNHGLDGGNRVLELLKFIFETPKQSNLSESKRA